MKFILILTMIYIPGSGGGGGLATAEFGSLSACHSAGKQWELQLQEYYPYVKKKRHKFYFCMGAN